MSNPIAIGEEIGNLTLLEASQLVRLLERKLGVTAQVAPAPVPTVAPVSVKEAEVTHQTIHLLEVGANKIAVIKEVRVILAGTGLAEAKQLVDRTPCQLGEAFPREQAEEIKAKLEAAGAKVSLK